MSGLNKPSESNNGIKSNKVEPISKGMDPEISSEAQQNSVTTSSFKQSTDKVTGNSIVDGIKRNNWIIASSNCPWQFFKNSHVEQSFQVFKRKQYVGLSSCPAFSAVCFGVVTFVFNALDFKTSEKWPVLCNCVFILMNTAFMCLFYAKEIPFRFVHIWTAIISAYSACQIFFMMLYASASTNSLTWMLAVVYVMYVSVPLQYVKCFALASGTLALHCAIEIYQKLSNREPLSQVLEQTALNSMWFFTASIFGSISYLNQETRLRATFKDRYAATATKMNIDHVRNIQDKLLCSVLPRPVANDISVNFSAFSTGSYREMCKLCQDEVSILFASICGLHSMTYRGVSDFVGILHDITTTIDRLSKTYYMQNVKSFSGSHNFICGALIRRADHALIAVYMGMALVEYIKNLRKKLKEPCLTLRVGIHSGEVFCAVVGQTQWQFDIFGNDVTIAKHVEMSAKPGQVYISHSTKTYLHEEFVIERHNSSSRYEENSQYKDIKLYCVKYVVKQYHASDYEKGTTFRRRNINILATDVQRLLKNSAKSYTLSNRQSSGNVCQFVTMYFNKAMEMSYRRQSDTFFFNWIIGVFVFLIADLTTTGSVKTLKLPEIIGFFVSSISVLVFPLLSKRLRASKILTYEDSFVNVVICIAFVTILVSTVTTISVLSMFDCVETSNSNNHTKLTDVTSDCLYPSYFLFVITVLTISVSSCMCIDHVTKSCILVGGIIFFWLSVSETTLDLQKYLNLVAHMDVPRSLISLADLTGITIAVLFTDRQVEKIMRRLFLISEDNIGLNENLSELTSRFEELVYTLLPSHIVPVLLDRLTSKSVAHGTPVDEAGIAVISFPEFVDKMADVEHERDGLDYVESLDDIFCSIDKMLEEQQFNNISKLKSFGSTLVFAFGLSRSSCNVQAEVTCQSLGAYKVVKLQSAIVDICRYLRFLNGQHKKTCGVNNLACFVLEIKEYLSTHNYSWKMRAGIHTGPIVEGLIGGKKPRYDVWGCTMDTAFLLESSGQLDELQVSEDAKLKLDNTKFTCSPIQTLIADDGSEFSTYTVTRRDNENT